MSLDRDLTPAEIDAGLRAFYAWWDSRPMRRPGPIEELVRAVYEAVVSAPTVEHLPKTTEG